MILVQFMIGMLLTLVPMRILRRRFSVEGLPPPMCFFSGRVAMFRAATALRGGSGIAIVPSYICNVVHRAFTEAGFRLVTYETNDVFEPDIEELKRLTRKHKGAVLCLAPLMGADGGQEYWTSTEGREWRVAHQTVLVLDLCQDIRRMRVRMPPGDGKYVLLSSFNNKSVAGLMGSVVIADIDGLECPPALRSDVSGIWRLWALEVARMTGITGMIRVLRRRGRGMGRGQAEDDSFEYSYCREFPYSLRHGGATKLQVALGVAGLYLLPAYEARKRKYLREGAIDPVRTPYFMTAAHVMSRYPQSTRLRSRSPYAVDGNPDRSLRPQAQAFHFRGYADT